MHTKFALFQSHLDLAHTYWKQLIDIGDTIIDATCGKGCDTLELAKSALKPGIGRVYSFDIQQSALDQAKLKIKQHLSLEVRRQIIWVLGSHADFIPEIEKESVKLIVYNLGYLPGGDKAITTVSQSTLESFKKAFDLILPGGAISITCYPGHPNGLVEQEALLAMAKELPSIEWNVCYHRWLNKTKSPGLLLLQKNR